MGSDNDTQSGGASVPRPARGGVSRLVSVVRSKRFREELLIAGSILALCCVVRWHRLSAIDYYEDTINKWHFIRQWFYENDFRHATWTHHMARFGMNVPVYLAQLFFGRTPYVYYLAPFLAFLGQVFVLYYLGRRLGGRAAGVVAALLRASFTGMDQGSCQLLPDGFGGTAMIITCYLLVRYQEATDAKRLRWLVGAGLALVWAYLIKESNALFGPGVVACVWLAKRRWRDVLVIVGIPILAVLLETAAFSLLTDYSSRLAIVEEAHGEASVTFFELFDRIGKLSTPWQMLFWLWIPSVLWLWTIPDKRVRPAILVPVGFMLLMMFLVRGFDPIILWMRFQNRYFDAVGPLMMIGVALFATELVRRLWLTHARASWRELFSKRTYLAVLAVPLLCAAFASVTIIRAHGSEADHQFDRIRNMSNIVNDAYRRNLPIVEKRAPKNTLEERRVRPLKAIYAVYLNDEYLARSDLAKRGELPDIFDAIKDSEHYSYILRDYRAYKGDELEKLVEQGCAVRVADRSKSLLVERTTKVPSGCRAPRGKPLRR